jgi:hypothetical protein
VDTSAFVGTNPTGELITSGLLIIQEEHTDSYLAFLGSHSNE